MIYNYPFYGFPRRYTRYSPYNYPQAINKNYPQFSASKPSDFPHNSQKNEDSLKKQEKKEDSRKEESDTLFEIFGIKLHSDDILLICLIFFLYNEGVQDQYLFIALILLLLS